MAGELAVRQSSVGKKAKRSVVLLRAGQLTWFKVKSADSAGGGAPTVVDLALATVKEDGDEAFSLWTPDHKHPVLFAADSTADRDLWLTAIRQQIADALADQHLDEEAAATHRRFVCNRRRHLGRLRSITFICCTVVSSQRRRRKRLEFGAAVRRHRCRSGGRRRRSYAGATSSHVEQDIRR
jgi:hypothetical protein